MENKKGQLGSIGLVAIIAFMFFMCGMLFITPLEDSIDTARNDLNCTSVATISDGTKMTCLVTDIALPYILITIISISLSLVVTKFVGGTPITG